MSKMKGVTLEMLWVKPFSLFSLWLLLGPENHGPHWLWNSNVMQK